MRTTTTDAVLRETARVLDQIKGMGLGERCLQTFFDEELSPDPGAEQALRRDPRGIAYLVDETMHRVMLSIASQFGLCLSQPTRFMLLVAEELKVHARHVKAEILGAPSMRSPARESLGRGGYDLDKDTQLSNRKVDEALRAKYGNEMEFLKALEEGRLAEARQFLGIIALLRGRDADDLLAQVELHNWEMELAVRMGDIELFLTAFRSFPDEANAVVDQLAGQLAQLVRDGMGTIVRVAPSPYALAQAQQTRRDLRALLEEQVQSLTMTAMRDLARELIETVTMSVEEFRDAVHSAFARAVSTYRLNPYFLDIFVQHTK